METKQSVRIQTSLLNGIEKKVLVWTAERLPKWVSSDMMTSLGIFGSVLFFAGYLLSNMDICWLWLATLGLFLNWFGDSLDGTIARVRKQQRPLYGYYLDHNVDVICEALMFFGAGLSSLMHFSVAMLIYTAYMALTIYVSINAHLKKEFKLTYAKMGPTEFRVIIMIVNTILIYTPSIREMVYPISFLGHDLTLTLLDFIGLGIWLILLVIYLVSLVKDARYFAKIDPLPKQNNEQ